MSAPELFTDSEMSRPSPKLRWHATNNVATGLLPDGQHFCVGTDVTGWGDTEQEAELDYCERMRAIECGVRHWSLAEFEKAIAPVTTTRVMEIEE